MVEGLRVQRPLIKFRLVLPIAALLLVATSCYRYYRGSPTALRAPGAALSSDEYRLHPMMVAQAVNLPAAVVALPLEVAVVGTRPLTMPGLEFVRIAEFSIIGIFFWFFMGRFVDDAIEWRQLRSGSRWRLSDCIVAALTAANSTLGFVAFTVGQNRGRGSIWLLFSSALWALLGFSALTFRIVQIRAYPRMKASNALEDSTEGQ
jgi:hypothetical protein